MGPSLFGAEFVRGRDVPESLKPIIIVLFHNDLLQKHCWLSRKSMTPNFIVVVSVLLQICCHIGSGMPYLWIFC